MLAVVGIVVIVSLSATPDRDAESEQVKQALAAMAGVDDVDVGYSNTMTQGVYLTVTLTMRQAAEAQIADAVDELARHQRRHFDDYSLTTKIVVGTGLTLKYGAAPDRAVVTEHTEEIRRLGVEVARSAVSWEPLHHTQARLEIVRASPTPEVLAAVRAAVGTQPTSVRIEPARNANAWTVSFPFTEETELRIRDELARLPTAAYSYVRIADDHLENLDVTVHDVNSAEQELRDLIAVVAPTPEHPLQLQWDFPREASQHSGSAAIYGCLTTQPHPGGQSSVSAGIQARIRADFDKCQR
ncbi:hypothetical protein ACFWUP_27810 [Nocardia sp. NPDC058658]|uniref:hypothetical protein n=1 Tax=Nocardia sp. NPDC058658 TaxID=3346580 RepID=UPI0036564661